MGKNKFKLAGLLIIGAFTVAACGESTEEESKSVESSASQTESGEIVLANEIENQSGFTRQVTNVSSGEKTSIVEIVEGDRPVLLWSSAPHCPTCKAEAPIIDAFAKEHADKIQVIGLGATDSESLAKEFLATTGIENHTLTWDKSSDYWTQNGFNSFPQIKLVSADLKTESDVMRGFDEDAILSMIS